MTYMNKPNSSKTQHKTTTLGQLNQSTSLCKCNKINETKKSLIN